MSNICDYLIVDAPFPPSLNALFEPHRIGKRCSIGKSSKYKHYYQRTFTPWWLSVRSKGKLVFGDEVMFWTVTCPPRAGSDTDNFHKCFLDCLQAAEAFPDDNVVVSTRNERGPRISTGLLRVFLANERHREQVLQDYESELINHWLPLRSGPILKRPSHLRHHRAAFAENPQLAVSQSGIVHPDTCG